MFTQQEVDVLLATELPDYYVNNLVTFAMQIPNRNATRLRNMYRKSVSYILGAGYASGTLISALINSVTSLNKALFVLKFPSDYWSFFCNYPWSWYTDRPMNTVLNVRVTSWLTQFLSFLTGWGNFLPGSGTANGDTTSLIGAVFDTIPRMVAQIFIYRSDLNIIHVTQGKQVIENYSIVDVTMKFVARMVDQVAVFTSSLPGVNGKVIGLFSLTDVTILTSASHFVRMSTDIFSGGIFSP